MAHEEHQKQMHSLVFLMGQSFVSKQADAYLVPSQPVQRCCSENQDTLVWESKTETLASAFSTGSMLSPGNEVGHDSHRVKGIERGSPELGNQNCHVFSY